MTFKNTHSSLNELQFAARDVDEALEAILVDRARGPVASHYNMIRYFLGFTDENFHEIGNSSGKRFRPGLCLFLAQAYGVRDKAFDAALAIELFHNFTLIHDDIEDHDEYRRNRPTVWKLWGVNNAINSGDALSLIASERCAIAGERSGAGERLVRAMHNTFLEVIEGQYMDFELATSPLDSEVVTLDWYSEMIGKKSGALVRVAAEVAGIVAGKQGKEIDHLREYGMSLGTAYQMADDFRSVWDTQEVTGKDTSSDVREHKRTYPFLAAYMQLKGADKKRLFNLYSQTHQLTQKEIEEVLSLFSKTSSREDTVRAMREYSDRARAAARELSVPESEKNNLIDLVDALVPDSQH
ncbi:MAG: hypothetical protein RLZZ342_616 [Candidatus Parcubacteria bacterium]